MEHRVRRAGPADAPALALIAGATFLETYVAILPVADMVAHVAEKCSAGMFADWAGRDDHVVTLAEHPDSGAPLGFSALTPPDLPIAIGPGDIELRRIYVLACAHGSGIGHALMSRAIQDARMLGKIRLALGVHPGNRVARAFYERHGFGVVGTRRFQVGESRFDDPVYARTI